MILIFFFQNGEALPITHTRTFCLPQSNLQWWKGTNRLDVYHCTGGATHAKATRCWPAPCQPPQLSHWSPELIVSSLPMCDVKLFMLSRALLFQGLLARRSPLWQYYLTAGPTLLHRPLNGSAAAVSQHHQSDQSSRWERWTGCSCAAYTHFPQKLTHRWMSHYSNVWKGQKSRQRSGTGVGKLRPAGHMRPLDLFNLAHRI